MWYQQQLERLEDFGGYVVICLKISTFVVSTTTSSSAGRFQYGCDLLKNIYLCGINNNAANVTTWFIHVVICLKISTFVVSTTTYKKGPVGCWGCDLLKNIYLCGINNNI